ncbi:MAG: UDP-N-acetylmuramate dehydrogenase [Chloroflexi bacterium]|nr:UDP-N-acetylmuramate dehydrogenase [Chloroflexota bacterium]
MTPERGVVLAPFTSLRVGGEAEFFAAARTGDDLAAALAWAHTRQVPARVIGGGSNLLIADAGVDGLVVRALMGRSETIERDGDTRVVADAGVTLASLARRLAKQGFSGLEWAANVPGTVGGAAVNNAGAFGGDAASCLIAVTVIDASGVERRLSSADLQYGYRTSALKRRELGEVAVERVEFRLQRGDADGPAARVKEFNAQRMRTQPRILSAGSVFANPDGTYAGKLIDEAGLKGARVGCAEISEQHANFIVNPGGARAADVYALMRRAQDVVYERSGVWLRPEIELFGRWRPQDRRALEAPRVVSG